MILPLYFHLTLMKISVLGLTRFLHNTLQLFTFYCVLYLLSITWTLGVFMMHHRHSVTCQNNPHSRINKFTYTCKQVKTFSDYLKCLVQKQDKSKFYIFFSSTTTLLVCRVFSVVVVFVDVLFFHFTILKIYESGLIRFLSRGLQLCISH